MAHSFPSLTSYIRMVDLSQSINTDTLLSTKVHTLSSFFGIYLLSFSCYSISSRIPCYIGCCIFLDSFWLWQFLNLPGFCDLDSFEYWLEWFLYISSLSNPLLICGSEPLGALYSLYINLWPHPTPQMEKVRRWSGRSRSTCKWQMNQGVASVASVLLILLLCFAFCFSAFSFLCFVTSEFLGGEEMRFFGFSHPSVSPA